MAIGQIVKTVGKSIALIAKNYGPEILTGIGITCKSAGAVVACVKTTHLSDVLDECNARLEAVPVDENGVQDKKLLKDAYVRNVMSVVKLYSIPAGLEVAGDICLIAGMGIRTKELTATAAALAAVEESYRQYVERTEASLEKDKKVLYEKEELVVDIPKTDETESGKSLVNVVKTTPEYVPTGMTEIVLNEKYWADWTGNSEEDISKIEYHLSKYANRILTSRYGSNTFMDIGAYITLNEIARGFDVDGRLDTPNGFTTAIFYDEDSTDIKPIKYRIWEVLVDDENGDKKYEYHIIFENARDIRTEMKRKNYLKRHKQFDEGIEEE